MVTNLPLKLNLSLLVPYLLAMALSLSMLGSISPDRVVQQAVFFAVGLVLMLYLSTQSFSLFQALGSRSYFLAVGLLLLTFVVGEAVRGSNRWIPLGSFNLQTSELAKPLLILAFAHYLDKYPPDNLKNIFLNLAIFLVPFLIIYFQPDLGTALVLAALFFAQLFIAGLPWLYLGLGGVLGFIGLRFAPLILHDYQLTRLKSFLDPYQDPLGAGYNVIQSAIAIGSGGILGKGLGNGTQSHLRFLPERHTDFMFASLSEELGGVGALVAILSLAYLLVSILTLILTGKKAVRYVAAGIFGYLFFQTFINIGMNLGLAPVTGVTLPLISYGGSSILGVSLTLGLLGSLQKDLRQGASLEIK